MTRIPEDNPSAIRGVPDELRGLLDYCRRCPMPHRCDLYTPDSTTPGQPGQIVGTYRCHHGHTWTRGHATDSSKPGRSSITRSNQALIGYLEHDDPDRPNTIGVWCTNCCTWHLHRVVSMVPDRVVRLVAKCFISRSPYRGGVYQVWSGDTPLGVARAARREPTPLERDIIRAGGSTSSIKKMRDSIISCPVEVVPDAAGWDCDATDPVTTAPVPGGALERPCALYWHYDADGLLLYVGISDQLAKRGKAHARASIWVVFAVTSRSVWFSSREAAVVAETAAIETDHPLFNRAHNNTLEARERLEDYLIKHGRTDLLAPAVSRG